MKKNAKFLFMFFLSAMIIAFTGCKPEVGEHEHTFAESWTSDAEYHWHEAVCEHELIKGKNLHTWEDGKITMKPTCTEDGKKTFTCEICRRKKRETLLKLGHDWNEGVITKEPSEESDGIETYTCNNCGEEKTESIEKLAHTHKFEEDWSYDEIDHWHAATCEHTTEKSGKEAHKWNDGVVTVDPSCADDGIKTFTCSICKKEKTESIERLSHTEDEGEVTTAVTCVTKGERTYKCKTCKAVLRTEEIPELYSSLVDAETGKAATAASTYVYFGVFPKTVLPENSAVTVDETVTVEMGANTYYKGNDGNYYAKVTENCYGSSGYTYTDGTTVKQKSAASTRYFKVEPIKWKVLTINYNKTGRALLLAEDILIANDTYYVDALNRTIGGSTVYSNNYKYSTIRAYLNGAYESGDEQTKNYEGKGFLQTAFTANARPLIADTEVDNSAESTTDTGNNLTEATDYACENTTDKIFLLSAKEVTTAAYGFAEYNCYGQGDARIRVTTDYAKANYAWQDTTTGYGGYWWLRSPYYYYSVSVRCVYSDGYVDFDDVNYPVGHGVVPALSISF